MLQQVEEVSKLFICNVFRKNHVYYSNCISILSLQLVLNHQGTLTVLTMAAEV